MSSINLNERRVAGSMLVLGFGLLMVAAILFTLDDASFSAALQAGLIVTVLGLATLELAVQEAGQQLLGRLGTIAFLIGTLPWLIADAMGTFVVDLERNYVVLACLSVAACGLAMLRAGLLPVVVGWASIAWALAWGVLYLGRVVQAPLGPNLAIVVFGLFLLLRPAQGRGPAR
ncbi:MAG: hypothetical protein ACRDGJ_03695 [Candidatus Limnocylindria bacterium]